MKGYDFNRIHQLIMDIAKIIWLCIVSQLIVSKTLLVERYAFLIKQG